MAKRKIAEKDFLESSLPQTRRSQFFDVVKNNYGLLFKVGLFLSFFFLILIIKNFFFDYLNVLARNAIKDGNLNETDANFWMSMLFLISNGIDVILYPLLFIGLAGALRILRQLAFSEGMMFSYLFKKGIKDNYKQFIVMGIITALFKLIINIALTLYSFNFLTVSLLFIFLIVYLPILVTYLYYSLIYSSNLAISLRNATYVYVRNLFPILLFVVIVFAPILLSEYFLNLLYIKQFIYLILVLFVLPMTLLGGFLMELNCFDKTINISEYHELIKKGLYISNEELEIYVDRGNKLKINRGYSNKELEEIKNILNQFQIKGRYVTSLEIKEGNVYKVTLDREYVYFLQILSGLDDIDDEDKKHLIKSKSESDYIKGSNDENYYRLYVDLAL